ncbi:MAG: beta-lactamase family protein, partial [Candidatus Aminicenantes bacterium]
MRKFFTFLLVFSFAYLSYPSIHASEKENYAEQIQIIERYVNANMKNLKIPGLAVGFYKDDFIWSKGFGFADLESRVPATSDTLFRAASVTKSMTAVGILKLADDGKINLDDEVQVYVPYFPKKKWPVTIRYLLGHLSGISHYRGNDADTIQTHYNTRQSIAIFADWELEAEPGTKYIYSSYGYNL